MMNRTQLLTYIRELEYHVATHPSDRWAAKLEAAKYVLSSGPAEAPAPVKGAVEGSRDLIPMSPRQGGLCNDPANAHRERITMTDGEAASSSCLDPPRARRPSGGRA